jgi:hypothetical protein
MSTLDDWILAQQAKGYSDSQIEERLLSNGYDKETVDKALLAIRMGNPTHVVPEDKNHGTFLWLGISFLILLVLIGGAYYYIQTTDSSAIKTYINKNIIPVKTVSNQTSNVTKGSHENAIDMTVNACGNNILESDEECDGNILGKSINESKCTDFRWNATTNYKGGNLTCVNCRHDFSACTH